MSPFFLGTDMNTPPFAEFKVNEMNDGAEIEIYMESETVKDFSLTDKSVDYPVVKVR